VFLITSTAKQNHVAPGESKPIGFDLSSLSQNLIPNAELVEIDENNNQHFFGIITQHSLIAIYCKIAEFVLTNYAKQSGHNDWWLNAVRKIASYDFEKDKILNVYYNKITTLYLDPNFDIFLGIYSIQYAIQTDIARINECIKLLTAKLFIADRQKELERQGQFIIDYFKSTDYLYSLNEK